MMMEVEPPAAEVTRTAAAVGGTEGAVEDAGGTDSMTRVAAVREGCLGSQCVCGADWSFQHSFE